jgi:hypothetical protein
MSGFRQERRRCCRRWLAKRAAAIRASRCPGFSARHLKGWGFACLAAAQLPSCQSPERATGADVGFMRGAVRGWPASRGPGPSGGLPLQGPGFRIIGNPISFKKRAGGLYGDGPRCPSPTAHPARSRQRHRSSSDSPERLLEQRSDSKPLEPPASRQSKSSPARRGKV